MEIFFVLSGFLVAYNYGDKELDHSLKGSLKYAFKKSKKFYFLHIITTIIMAVPFVENFLKYGASNSKIFNKFIVDILLNVTLLKSWYWPSAFSLNGVSWFLSSLIFAYFLVPLLVKVFRNREINWYWLVFLLLLALKFVLDTYGYKFPHKWILGFSLYTNPVYRAIEFVIGYSAFKAFNSVGLLIEDAMVNSILQISAILLYSVACACFDKLWLPSSYIILTIILVYACVQKGVLCDWIFGNRVAVYLGNISFEMYILHAVLLRYVGKYLKGIHSNQMKWVIILIVTIVVSALINTQFGRKFNFYSLKNISRE